MATEARPKKVLEETSTTQAGPVAAGQYIVPYVMLLWRAGLLVQGDDPQEGDEIAGISLESFDLSYEGAADGGRHKGNGKRGCSYDSSGGRYRAKYVGRELDPITDVRAPLYVVDAQTVTVIDLEDEEEVPASAVRCGFLEEKLSESEVAVRLERLG